MPSAPEILNTLCRIGKIKIFRKLEPEKLSQAYGHVTIPGEVIVYLQCIANKRQPCRSPGDVRNLLVQNGVNHLPESIGDKHLFSQSLDKP